MLSPTLPDHKDMLWLKAHSYFARTETFVQGWRERRMTSLLGSQFFLDTIPEQHIFLVSCQRAIVWLVDSKWAWLTCFFAGAEWTVLRLRWRRRGGSTRCSVQNELCSCSRHLIKRKKCLCFCVVRVRLKTDSAVDFKRDSTNTDDYKR